MMVEINTVLNLLQTISIIVGITYYLMVLNNQQKSQRHAEETRQATLFMQSYRDTATRDMQILSMELLAWEWDDYEEFVDKYVSDPVQSGKWVTFFLYFHGLGILLEEGYIPAKILYKMDQSGMATIMYWTKFKPIVERERLIHNNPEHGKYFEYYATEMMRLRKLNGLSTEWSVKEKRFID
jgi:hypothetical protein